MKTIPLPTAEQEVRFWAKVQRIGNCLEWVAGKTEDGYGLFTFGGIQYRAHRIAWTIAHGPIPPGMMVCHNCPDGDNPACVDVNHLFLGDNDVNTQDRHRKGRTATADRSGMRLYPERYKGPRPGRTLGGIKRRGELHGGAKLTSEQVIEIRRRYAAGGTSWSKLSAEFGVSKKQIGRILKHEKWGHI